MYEEKGVELRDVRGFSGFSQSFVCYCMSTAKLMPISCHKPSALKILGHHHAGTCGV